MLLIPGYGAAVEREIRVRESVFAARVESICGISVFPLTARHLNLLIGVESPFVCGGRVAYLDISQFFWIVRNRKGLKPILAWRISGLNYDQLLRAIDVYIDDSFMDQPGGSESESRSPASVTAMLVDSIASCYGWSRNEILDLPLKEAWQYVRLIQRRDNPKLPVINSSDKLKAEWLISRNKSVS